MSDNSLRVNQFKATLWAAADTLRGNMDPSEYKQVFLGLIFLKYISERFERKYEELKSENLGYENNKDEYTSCGIYFIPSNARWSTIMEHCDTPYIGQYIDDAIRYIERDNPELKGVLPKYYARAELDQNRLTTLMRQFDTYLDTEADSDMLSVAYEYCLAKFAEQEGRRAGEFYTPAGIVNVLVQSLDIKDGRLYDESVPRLIQYNGTDIAKKPGNMGFLAEAAHGSLFLLPGNPLWSQSSMGTAGEDCIPY